MRYATDGKQIYCFHSTDERDAWLADAAGRRALAGTCREVKRAIYRDRVVLVKGSREQQGDHY